MPNKLFGIADPYYDALRVQSNQAVWPDAGGSSSGIGGLLENKIYLWPADGSTIATFDPTEAGLIAALAAAASGDTVWMPSIPIACTSSITIPAGVALKAIDLIAPLTFGTLGGGVPAFPSTPIKDNFNRGDEGPPPSANWTTPASPWVGVQVVSSEAAASSWTSAAVWNVETFGPDCEVYVTLASRSSSPANFDIFLRGSSLNLDDGAAKLYELGVGWNGSIFRGQIYKSSSYSTVGASFDLGIGPGDSVGLRAIGYDLTVWQKIGGGAWTLVYSVNDPDATANIAGYISLDLIQPNLTLDNFGGGTVVLTSDPAITLSAGSRLVDLTITQTANDSNNLVLIQGPASGNASVDHCSLNCAQAGSGDAIALDGAAGTVYVNDSYLNGNSGSGTGYGVKSGAGAITLDDCWVIGSTAPLNVGAGSIFTNGVRMSAVAGEPAQGDRSAWNTATYFNRHASDIAGSTFTYHNNPSIAPATAFVSTAINLTLNNTHHRVKVTAVATITLPTAVGISGQEYIIKAMVDGVVVNTTSSQTIDGELTKTLLANDCMVVFSDGANWLVG